MATLPLPIDKGIQAFMEHFGKPVEFLRLRYELHRFYSDMQHRGTRMAMVYTDWVFNLSHFDLNIAKDHLFGFLAIFVKMLTTQMHRYLGYPMREAQHEIQREIVEVLKLCNEDIKEKIIKETAEDFNYAI